MDDSNLYIKLKLLKKRTKVAYKVPGNFKKLNIDRIRFLSLKF